MVKFIEGKVFIPGNVHRSQKMNLSIVVTNIKREQKIEMQKIKKMKKDYEKTRITTMPSYRKWDILALRWMNIFSVKSMQQRNAREPRNPMD